MPKNAKPDRELSDWIASILPDVTAAPGGMAEGVPPERGVSSGSNAGVAGVAGVAGGLKVPLRKWRVSEQSF